MVGREEDKQTKIVKFTDVSEAFCKGCPQGQKPSKIGVLDVLSCIPSRPKGVPCSERGPNHFQLYHQTLSTPSRTKGPLQFFYFPTGSVNLGFRDI